jgi:hypothetical protein
MNTASNIKMLSKEMPKGDESSLVNPSSRYSLLRLWSWIDRVESLCAESEDLEDASLWPAKGLLNAGIWRLLRMDEQEYDGEEDQLSFSEELSIKTYESPARR